MEKKNNPTLETTIQNNQRQGSVIPPSQFMFVPVDKLFETPETDQFVNTANIAAVQQLDAYAPSINKYAINAYGNMANPDPTLATDTYDPVKQQNPAQRWIDRIDSTPAYDAGPGQNRVDSTYSGIRAGNFMRYYEHPKFADIGYTPYSNIEASYNANSTVWDDMARMRGQFGSLVGAGFKSVYRSMGDIFTGDFSGADVESAREFEDAMAIGNSTRDGALAWTNNLLLNSGYTFGIIGSIAVEELALTLGAAAAASTGVGAIPAAGAWAIGQANILRKIGNVFTGTKLFKGTRNMMKSLNNVGNAKDVYYGTQGLGRGTNMFLDFIAPETMYAIRKLKTAKNGTQNVFNMGKGSSLFGGFYRDIRALNYALAEGKLEGGMVYNKLINELSSITAAQNFGEIQEGDMASISEKAAKGAFATTLANVPVIYLSNKFVLGNALGGFNRSIGRMFNDSYRGIGRRLIKSKPTRKKSGGFNESPFSDAGKGFSGWLNKVKAGGIKGNAGMAAGATLRYFAANISEGIQEVTQEAISAATTGYFTAVTRDPMAGGFELQKEMVNSAIGSQFSEEGFDVFMSGFLMGGVVQGPQKLFFQGVPAIYQRINDPQAYKDLKQAEEDMISKLVEVHNTAWNNQINDPNSMFDPTKFNFLIQKQIKDGMKEDMFQDDMFNFKNKQDYAKFQQIYTIMNNQSSFYFQEQLKDFMNLSDEELAEAFPSTKKDIKNGKLRHRLQKMINQIGETQDFYNEAKDRYQNPHDPKSFKPGSREYIKETLAYMGYEHARYLYLFTQDSFSAALKRADSIFSNLSQEPLFQNMAAKDITVLLDPASIQKEINLLLAEINNSDIKQDENGNLQRDNKGVPIGATSAARAEIKSKNERMKRLQAIYKIVTDPKNATSTKGGRKGAFDRRKIEKLRKEFFNYMRFMASESSDGFINEAKVENALKMMVDYMALKGSAKTYYKAIEYLQDPTKFQEIVDRTFEFNKQAYRNIQKNFKSVIENYVGVVKANELLNQLAALGIYADINQTKVFLQTGVVDVLKTFYNADGSVTPLQDEVTWNLIQEKLKAYRKQTETQSTKAETQEEKQAAKVADENKTKQDEVLDKSGVEVIVENENNSPMLDELLMTQYKKYEAEMLASMKQGSKKSKIGFQEWRNTEEGLNYKNTFNAIKKIWADETNASPEDIQSEVGLQEWLNSRDGRENDLVGQVLAISNLSYNDIFDTGIEYNEPGEQVAGKANTEILISGSTVNVVKVTDPDVGAFYMVTDKKGNPISSTLRSLVDPENNNPESTYKTKAAARKVFEQLEDAAPDSTSYSIGGFTVNQGSSLFDKITGVEYIVLSTPKAVRVGSIIVAPKNKIDETEEVLAENIERKFLQKPLDLTKYTTDVSRLTVEDLLGFYPHINIDERDNADYATGKQRLKLILSVLTPEQINSLELVIKLNEDAGKKRNNFVIPGKEANSSIKQVREKYTIGLRFIGSSPEDFQTTKEKINSVLEGAGIKPSDQADGIFAYLPNNRNIYTDTKGVALPDQVNLTYDQLFNLVDLSDFKGVPKEEIVKYFTQVFGINSLLTEFIDRTFEGDVFTLNAKQLPYGMSFSLQGVKLDMQKGILNSFDTLQYNTSDNSGGLIIYDIQAGTVVPVTNKKTLAEQKKLREEVKAGLEKSGQWSEMVEQSKGNSSGIRQNSDRYRAAVLLPNGTYVLVPLKARSYTPQQMNDLAISLITKAQEVQKNNKYPKQFNIDLENSLFISFAQGYDLELKVDKFGKVQLLKYNKLTKERTFYELDKDEVNKVEEGLTPAKKLSNLIEKFNNDEVNKEIKFKGKTVVLGSKNFREHLPRNTDVNTIINNTTTPVANNVIVPQKLLLNASSQSVLQALQLTKVINSVDTQTEDAPEQDVSVPRAPASSTVFVELEEISDQDFADYKDEGFASVPVEYINKIVQKRVAGEELTERETELESARITEITLLVNSKQKQGIDTSEIENPTNEVASLSDVIIELDKLKEELTQGVPFKEKGKVLRESKKYQNLLKLRKKLDKGANKVVRDTSELKPEDIEDINTFTTWAEGALPDFITTADIETLGNNLKAGGVRVGAFVMVLKEIAGELKINGTIYTGANSPFKYHEAFHGVFRMLLTDEQINQYIGIAKKEVRAKLRSEGKSLEIELQKFKNSADTYANMTRAELEREYYEEYLADEFEKFKMNPKSTKTNSIIKSFFNRIMEWIKSVLGAKTELASLDSLFESIDAGKFKGASLVRNQFTADMQVGIASEANALVPYAEITQNGVKGNLYLSNNIANPLIHGIAAHYIQAERKAASEGPYSPREVMNEVLDNFRNLYNVENPINAERSDIQKQRLTEIGLAFDRFEDVIQEQVFEYLNIINGQLVDAVYNEEYFSDITGIRSASQFDTDASNIGGINSIPGFLRAYLATTTVTEQDYFGNTILVEGEPLIVPVNFNEAYNGILKSVKNLTAPIDILKSLYLFGQSNVNSGAVIDRILLDTFGEINPQAILDGSALSLPIKDPLLLQQIIKGFSNFRVEYIFTEIDQQGNSLVYSAAQRDDINSQMDRWAQAFLYKQEKLISDKKRKNQAVDAIQDLYDAISLNSETETDEVLSNKAKELSEQIYQYVGIRFSPLYLKYNFIAAKSTDALKPSQIALLNLNPNGQRLVLEDIEQMSRQIQRNQDIFDTGEMGMNSRLRAMAESNAMFDETIGASVFRNANGDLVYAHQNGTYHLTSIAELNDPNNIQRKLEDPALENNYLLNDPAFLKLSLTNRLKVLRVAGLKQKDRITGEDISGNVLGTDTYGDFSPRQFLSTLLNNYTANVNTKSGKVSTVEYLDEEGNTQERAIASVLIRVMEASNTGDQIDLPVIKAVELVGNEVKLTEEAVDIIVNNIRNEFARINREFNPDTATKDTVGGYNTEGGRAYTFFNTGVLLSEELKNKLISIAKLQGEQGNTITLDQALENAAGMTALRKVVVDNLENQVTEFKEVIESENASDLISKKVKQGLVRAQGFSTPDLQRSNELLNLTDNFDYNLKQIFVNDYINTFSINEILLGDQATSLKDPVDKIKRAKMQNASYYNAYSAFPSPDQGVLHSVEKISLISFTEPQGVSSFSNASIDKADAQMYMTTKAFRYLWFGMGLLKPEQVELLDHLDVGLEPITGNRVFGYDNKAGLAKAQALINSKKLVYGDGKTYLKMSAFVLTKDYTSDWNADKGVWVAKPNRVELHNLRVKMEAQEAREQTISIAAPVSAVKMEKRNVVDISEFNNETELKSEQFTDLDARYMGLQVVSPSNKMDIVDMSQIKELVTSEQDDSVKVEGLKNPDGTTMTIADVRKAYSDALSNRVLFKYKNRRNLVFDFQTAMDEFTLSKKDNVITPKLAAFLRYATAGLKASQASSNLLEFFADDAGISYNLNNAISVRKAESLFMSYFSRGVLAERVPGVTVNLVSDYGNKVYRRVYEFDENGLPLRSEIIRQKQWEAMSTKPEIFESTNDTDSNKPQSWLGVDPGKDGVVILDRLRSGLMEYTDPKDPESLTGQRYTEFMMPAHDKDVMEMIEDKVDASMPSVISKFFGVRIPSQDKHSSVNMKLVDFMPVYYGSSAMFAQELIETSGADFDIDKVFALMKEYYIKDGQFVEYGKEASLTEEYNAYINYVNEKVTKPGTIYSESLEQYKDNAVKPEHQLSDAEVDLVTIPDGPVSEESRKALMMLGLPVTKAQYAKYKEDHGFPYEAPYNNEVLDYRYALVGNRGMTESSTGIPIAYSPANDNIVKTTLDVLAGKSQVFSDRLQEDNVDVDNLLGKTKAFKSNKGASIGAVVLPNLYLSLLTESKKKLDWDFWLKSNKLVNGAFELDGIKYDSFAESTEVGGLQRKQDTLSALISIAVDNAKDRYISKLGLSKPAMSVMANMIALGVPLEVATLFINLPVIQDAFNARVDSGIKLTTYAEKILRSDEYKSIKSTKLTKELMYDFIDGNLVDSQDVTKSALEELIKISGLVEVTSKMGAITSLTKGLPSSIVELNNLKRTIQELKTQGLISVSDLYNDTWRGTYVNIVNQLTDVLLPEVFISSTKPFVGMYTKLLDGMDIPVTPEITKIQNDISLNIVSYLTLQAYLHNALQTDGQLAATLSNSFVYPQPVIDGQSVQSIISVVQDLQKRESLADNFFLQNFVLLLSADNSNNKTGMNLAQANTFRNLSSSQKIDLQTSFAQLYNTIETRKSAEAIINYIMVKDGLELGYASLLEAISPYTLNTYLNQVNNVQKALNGKATFESVFGLSQADLEKTLLDNYLLSTSSQEYVKTIYQGGPAQERRSLPEGYSFKDGNLVFNTEENQEKSFAFVRLGNINEFGNIDYFLFTRDLASKKEVVYKRVQPMGSKQQTPIGFIFGDRPTLSENNNFIDRKNAQNYSEENQIDAPVQTTDIAFDPVEEAIKTESSIVEATERSVTVQAAGPESTPVNIADTQEIQQQLFDNQEVMDNDEREALVLKAMEEEYIPSDPGNLDNIVYEQMEFQFEEEVEEQYPDIANEYDRLLENKNNIPILQQEKLFPLDSMIEQYEEMRKINVNLTEEEFKEHLKCLGLN